MGGKWEKISETKGWFFEKKNNNFDNALAGMIRKKKMTQISKLVMKQRMEVQIPQIFKR